MSGCSRAGPSSGKSRWVAIWEACCFRHGGGANVTPASICDTGCPDRASRGQSSPPVADRPRPHRVVRTATAIVGGLSVLATVVAVSYSVPRRKYQWSPLDKLNVRAGLLEQVGVDSTPATAITLKESASTAVWALSTTTAPPSVSTARTFASRYRHDVSGVIGIGASGCSGSSVEQVRARWPGSRQTDSRATEVRVAALPGPRGRQWRPGAPRPRLHLVKAAQPASCSRPLATGLATSTRVTFTTPGTYRTVADANANA